MANHTTTATIYSHKNGDAAGRQALNKPKPEVTAQGEKQRSYEVAPGVRIYPPTPSQSWLRWRAYWDQKAKERQEREEWIKQARATLMKSTRSCKRGSKNLSTNARQTDLNLE